MNKNKIKVLFAVLFAALFMSLMTTATFAAVPTVSSSYTGWKTESGKKYYFKKGKAVKGHQTINGKKYYFKSDYTMAKGIVKIGGKSYCFASNGVKVTNKYGYKSGSNYYKVSSSGIAKKLGIAEGLAGNRLDKFTGSKTQRLRKAFDWSRKLTYYPITPTVSKNETKVQAFAKFGFKNLKGDCAVQAATFCLMAKALGYSATMIEGYVPQRNGKLGAHAWCEIKMSGKTYVYDPNMAATYYSQNKNAGYKVTYGQKGTYKYYGKDKKEIKKK